MHRQHASRGASVSFLWEGMTQQQLLEAENLLQLCRRKKSIALARQLLVYILELGLENNAVLSCCLVPVFVECGGLPDAQHIFDSFPHANRNQYSWGSLISGYVDCGEYQHALCLYHNMLEASIFPNAFTYVALLKACGRLQDVSHGGRIHDQIIKVGWEGDSFVGSTVVDMYGKCGSLKEAHHVFARIRYRDLVLWNVLISAYAECGFEEEAQSCVRLMHLEGISPDTFTFVCSLKACGSRAFQTGQELHMQITERGFEKDTHVHQALVDMYAKCGLFTEVQTLFNQWPVRNGVPWTTLIAAYVESNRGHDALSCYRQMQMEDISPTFVTFICTLKACGGTGASETGQQIHAEVTKRGLEKELYVGTTLVDMYSKCSLLSEAQDVFDRLSVHGAISWHALIAGYDEYGFDDQVLNCYRQMQLHGIPPVPATFTCSLRACSIKKAIETGRDIHSEILKRGLDREIDVGNTLVDVYSKCSSFAEARFMLDYQPVRTVVPWTALISAYAENGLGDEVMLSLEEMQKEGVCPDAITFICSMKGCGLSGAVEIGRMIHFELIKRGLEQDLYVGTTLVDMYAKSGSFAEAREVLALLPVRGAISWNALIAAYSEYGFGEEAYESYKEMQMEGTSPVAVTFVCSLKACGIIHSLEIGQELHAEVCKRGWEREIEVGNTLVDMYAKLGWLEDAQKLFEQMPVGNIVAWTALIAGYAENGHGEEALKCFKRMQMIGISPDPNALVCSLKACSSIGALETGQEIHDEIIRKGLERELIVDHTLVELYAKCGSLVEAWKLLDGLPARDSVCWNILIGGCIDNGFGEEALNCYKRMKLEGVAPVAITCACSLKACGLVGAIETGKSIHADISAKGLDRDVHVCTALIDMYAKCSSLTDMKKVFDSGPVQGVALWNAMIKGYGENHEEKMAVECFDDMRGQNVKPDAITFTCLLAACSHANLVTKGQEYFKLMKEDYNIVPTMDHHIYIVNLLAGSGQIYEAERFAEAMRCLSSKEILGALLGACKIYGEVDLGLRYFQQLVRLNLEDAAAYQMLADIYASAGRLSDANHRFLMENKSCEC